MAERRMFAKSIVDSDAFIELPMSARLLYYDLGMRADDDGFVNSPKKIMCITGATNDDMNILLMRKFVLAFDNGVVVIKHWRIHNYIAKDRYKPTNYKEQKALLEFDENGSYRMAKNPVDSLYTNCTQPVSNLLPECIQTVSTLEPQDREGEISKDKISIDKNSIEREKRASRFNPPTLEEVRKYAWEHCKNVDADHFYEYFTTPNDKGETWVDSKGNKVRNWKQKMLTWEKMNSQSSKTDRARKNNTLLNYKEQGVGHVNLEHIALNLEEL